MSEKGIGVNSDFCDRITIKVIAIIYMAIIIVIVAVATNNAVVVIRNAILIVTISCWALMQALPCSRALSRATEPNRYSFQTTTSALGLGCLVVGNSRHTCIVHCIRVPPSSPHLI